MDPKLLVTVILFGPLIGAVVAGLFGRRIGDNVSRGVTTGFLFLSAILSWVVFSQWTWGGLEPFTVTYAPFIHVGSFVSNWSFRLDGLSAVMLVVVTSVSSLVHLYSWGYMADDPSKPRFFAYLSLFTFSMLALISAADFMQLFFGWEGVGLASYLLIGFWFHKPTANAAAIKAFVVNRVGDFGFALGIVTVFWAYGSIEFAKVFPQIAASVPRGWDFAGGHFALVDLACALLFVGAMGKSAQFFLHTWLPDAMEGPTPVSALIHAATMVTAGVYMVCLLSPMFEYAPVAKAIVTGIGAITALFAATVGMTQNDIKRVIAYSTCSQLGYMFMAAGVGAYQAGMFHLFTHAFFKAMLFLGAGSVITAMHHEQDMRNYGGLRKKVPFTFAMMMIGTLAITGVGIPFSGEWFGTPIGFAGFLSKDAIIESAFAGGSMYAFTLLVVAACFTSFYSWRLIFMTFYGPEKGDHHAHAQAHESPLVMTIPLAVLALGAVFAGMIWFNDFFGNHETMAHFFSLPHEGGHEIGAIFMGPDNHVIELAHESPVWVSLAPFMAMLLGLAVAYLFYIRNPKLPAQLAEQQAPLYRFLLNKWYFDELYDVIFVRSAKALGALLWKRGDGDIIDGSLNGIAMGIVPFFTRLAGRAQSGYIFTYAFAMVLGIVGLITWMSIAGGTH